MNAVNTSLFKPFVFLVGSKTDLLVSQWKKCVQSVLNFIFQSKCGLRSAETSSMLMAGEINAEYWAVSAKTGYNIDNLFRRIAALTFNKLFLKELEEKRIEIGSADMICKRDIQPQTVY